MRRILIVIAVLVIGLLAGLTAFDFIAPETAARLGVEMERSRSGLVAKRISVEGFDIAYLEGGQGEPMILVHGFGADKDNFTRVSKYLTPHYRVIIPDLPGFGESSKSDRVDYYIADQADRVRALALALDIPRAHFGGSSMGGAIITAHAHRYPDATASLWLLGPAGLSKAFDSELTRAIAETGSNPLLAQTPEQFPAIMDFVMSKPPFFPYSIKKVLGERAAADYPLHKRIFEQLNVPDRPYRIQDDIIKGIQAPALVVWGSEDRALNYEAAAVYKANMPNAELIIMAGIGHLPMIEAPKQSAQDYLAFLSSLQ